jgi:hypothetical protein
MTMIYRRHFLRATTLLLAARALGAPADMALAQQLSDKPLVKRSEARPMILKYIEKMSQDAKEHTGVELSQKQKNDLVNDILSKMEAQGTYAFIDP